MNASRRDKPPGAVMLRELAWAPEFEPPRRSSLRSRAPAEPAMVFGLALASLCVAAGVVLRLQAGQIDPARIKAELHARLGGIERRYGANQLIEKDDALHAPLLSGLYQHYGGDAYSGLVKAHRVLHDKAQLQWAADREVREFLEEVDAAPDTPTRSVETWEARYERARKLSCRFDSTSYGPRLRETLAKLRTCIEGSESCCGRTWCGPCVAPRPH